MRKCVVAITVSLLMLTTAATGELTPQQWLEDLDQFEREVPRRHRNAFHNISPDRFRAEVASLRHRIPDLPQHLIVTEFQKLGALLGDAHSGVSPTRPEMMALSYPLRVYQYDDGLFVQAAPPELRDLLGARIVRVGRLPVQDVLDRAGELTPASNEMTVRDFVIFRFRAEVLHSIGAIEAPGGAEFVFDINGRELRRTLMPMGRDGEGKPLRGGISYPMGAAPGSNWLEAMRSPSPLWLRDQQTWYWSQRLPDHNAMYAQINIIGDQEGKPMLQEFFDDVMEAVERERIGRLIIDLRHNGGGNNELLLPLIHRIVRSDSINADGKLFVLIGRRTQSAAQNFVNLLERQTRATFVGEPTGESPNHYGDPVDFELTNSRLSVSLSSLYWQDVHPADARRTTSPHLRVPYNSADYATGRDPVLDAALTRR